MLRSALYTYYIIHSHHHRNHHLIRLSTLCGRIPLISPLYLQLPLDVSSQFKNQFPNQKCFQVPRGQAPREYPQPSASYHIMQLKIKYRNIPWVLFKTEIAYTVITTRYFCRFQFHWEFKCSKGLGICLWTPMGAPSLGLHYYRLALLRSPCTHPKLNCSTCHCKPTASGRWKSKLGLLWNRCVWMQHF